MSIISYCCCIAQSKLNSTPWVKKQYSKLLSITLPNINRFWKFFTVTLNRKFAIKLSLKIPPHLNCVATIRSEILVFKKIAPTTSTATADEALMHWRECDRSRWPGTKPVWPATDSSFNTSNNTVWCRTGSFFSLRSWFENFKRRQLKINWNKSPCKAQLLKAVAE